MNTKYITTKPMQRLGGDIPVGTTVYLYTGYDYGLAADDNRVFGTPHVCVSMLPNKTPFFTAPLDSIVKQPADDGAVISHMVDSLVNPPITAKELYPA